MHLHCCVRVLCVLKTPHITAMDLISITANALKHTDPYLITKYTQKATKHIKPVNAYQSVMHFNPENRTQRFPDHESCTDMMNIHLMLLQLLNKGLFILGETCPWPPTDWLVSVDWWIDKVYSPGISHAYYFAHDRKPVPTFDTADDLEYRSTQ